MSGEPVEPTTDAPGGQADATPPVAPTPAAVPSGPSGRLGRLWWVVGIAIAALVVIVLAPRASSDPDGLERVAEDVGFIDQAENMVSGILGDYAIPGIDDPAVSTVLSGLVGIAVVLVVMFVIGRVLARRRT